jgi:hypothetical protein
MPTRLSRFVRWALPIVVLALPATALAYGKPTHGKLTEAAVQRFDACLKLRGKALTAAAAARPVEASPAASQLAVLRDCNLAQDRVGRKALLWHFYSPDRALAPGRNFGHTLVVETTLHHWVDMLEADVERTKTRAEAYPLLGALLHFIQDAAVPPHVVPVFHPEIDIKRLRVDLKDSFDAYDPGVATGSPDAAWCEAVFKPVPNLKFKDLLRKLAEDTRGRAVGKLPAEAAKEVAKAGLSPLNPPTWALFWKPPAPNGDGFGEYGCVGDKFGSKGKLTCEKKSFKIPKKVFDDFARQQWEDAIEASVRAIVLLQTKIAEPGADEGALSCPVAGKTATLTRNGVERRAVEGDDEE